MTNGRKPWFNIYPVDVPKSIKYPPFPLHGLLRRTAKLYPEQIALCCGEEEITYTQLESLSNKFANALIGLGVKKGSCVALFLPNIPQFVVAYFGILKTGAVVTAINPVNREREVKHQLIDSGAQTVVSLDSLYSVIEKIKEETALKNIILTPLIECGLQNINPITISPSLSFQKLLKGSSSEAPNIKVNQNEDLAALQYTGGTTGTAKGAMLTHKNLVSNAIAFAVWIKGTTAKETFLTALPLFHIYGMTTSMTTPITLAAKIVLIPKFEPTNVLEAIQKQKVTVFCGVPTMYTVLLSTPNLGKYDLTSIRVCISGASSLSPQIQKKFMEITGGFLAEGYGLTEASPVTHCNPVDKTLRTLKVGSIGLPLPDTEAKIVDLGTGHRIEPGETGELAVKGPQVMKGYWQKPEETAQVLHDGWLLTGDIARMSQDGYFYITDRKKALIKYKDYSVYPREIEDVLYEYPAVKLCAVVGKKDRVAGEIPKAFIVLKEGMTASAEEITVFVNARVAPYKAIREIEFRKDLPISSAGKVLKRLLQEER